MEKTKLQSLFKKKPPAFRLIPVAGAKASVLEGYSAVVLHETEKTVEGYVVCWKKAKNPQERAKKAAGWSSRFCGIG